MARPEIPPTRRGGSPLRALKLVSSIHRTVSFIALVLAAAVPSDQAYSFPHASTFVLSSPFNNRNRPSAIGPLCNAFPSDDISPRENADDDSDDDDEEDNIKPYGNRSLAWTKRYRKMIPYEAARKRVLKFGHRSKEDWDECVANGWQGQYVPARPDEMYEPEWVSWDEFLGLMRPYDEARHIAVNVLGLKDIDQYVLFISQNPKRAEGLRMPLRPDKVYKDKGWIDAEHFFQRGGGSE